jgi:SAM-dependent methyltransferase
MGILNKFLSIVKQPPSLALTDTQNMKIAKALASIGPDGIMLNVGSKDVRLTDRVINIDIAPYKNVDLICDAQKLSLKDESVDAFAVVALLEIVERPELVLDEIHRVLKPGGLVVATTPFLQTYHPDPIDSRRFTIHGARKLFDRFEIEEVVPTRGVFGSFLGLLKDYLAVFFSFNNLFLWKVNNIVFQWVLAPLKYLDRVMPNYRMAEYVSSSFTVIARKRSSAPE